MYINENYVFLDMRNKNKRINTQTRDKNKQTKQNWRGEEMFRAGYWFLKQLPVGNWPVLVMLAWMTENLQRHLHWASLHYKLLEQWNIHRTLGHSWL